MGNGDMIPRSRLDAVEQELIEAREKLAQIQINAITEIKRLEGEVINLSTLVKRLMRHVPDGLNVSVKEQAANYLKDHGLEGSILR